MGNLQLEILKVLWKDGPLPVADVHARLPGASDLAYTTVATVLRKMDTRGLVRHKRLGRKFVYLAAVTAQAVNTELAGDVLDRVFGGRLTDMVNHLLQNREVVGDELDELARMIAARRRRKS